MRFDCTGWWDGVPVALACGSMDPAQLRGVRAGIAAYVLWGLLTVYWKQLSAFDAVELIGWRMAMAAAVMALVLTVRHRWTVVISAFRSRALTLRLGVASMLLTVNWTMYVWAVVNDHIIETALGYFLAPLGTMTIGVVVLGERLTPARRLAAVFAVAAVVVLTVSYGRLPFVALVIAGTWSLYGLIKRQVPMSPVESLAGETFILLIPALGVITWGAMRADSIPATADASDWMFVVGTGVVTAVPLLLFSVAARSVPFTVLGPLNYLVPLINFALGWIVYGEQMPTSRFVGFALIWLALMAVTVDALRTSRRATIVQPIATA
jgi:chloramphenicol-sensitive protein RarD